MRAADAAEARGDALGALRVIMSRPHDPEGRLFWRPERVHRLVQLAHLGDAVPSWAVSRWILAQAVQSLDTSGSGIVRQAVALTDGITGHFYDREDGDLTEQWAAMTDHDWVFRQAYLYDLGGLAAFLKDRATPELVARADRITDWADAEMGAYRLVRRGLATERWERVTDGVAVESINLGGSLGIEVGDHAIGRLMACDAGHLFESLPLWVPPQVAEAVAADPGCWLEALSPLPVETAEEEGVFTVVDEYPLLSDLSSGLCALRLVERPDLIHTMSTQRFSISAAQGALATARRLAAHASSPTERDVDDAPFLAGALLDPSVVEVLPLLANLEDREALSALAGLLPEPAASSCASLARPAADEVA